MPQVRGPADGRELVAAVAVVEALPDGEARGQYIRHLLMNLSTIEQMGHGVTFDEVITGKKIEIHYDDPSIDHAKAVKVTECGLDMVDPDWHLSCQVIPAKE